MTIFGLIFKEIIHRKINFMLGLLAVLIAVALLISFFTTGRASKHETARLMLNMGFNLRIIPKKTDMSKFWMDGFSEHTMPENYIDVFASQKGISYNHLVATLQAKILWQGVEVILTGLAPERCPPGREKPPMRFEIKQGTVYIGYELAQRLKLKKGKTIDVRSKTLTVEKTLSESGGVDDIRIQCHLRDVQDILDLKGQINEIKAIDCLCFALTDDPLAILRKELAAVLPEAKTIQMKPMATARAQTRQLVRNIFAVIMPIVVVACGTWIGVLAIMNVQDRQQEIGIMRALGYGSGQITLLFLGKAVIIGLLGATVGFFTGTALALNFGPGIFKVTAKAIKPEYVWFVWSLVAAPVFTAVSSFIPAMIAVTYEPAVTLREK